MINPDAIFGRLGNRMFQMAKLYADSRELGADFYFQDPKYFEKYKEEIRALFGGGITSMPCVAIHVRRGGNPINPNEPNYSENPFYVDLCKTDYYERAMEMFPGAHFLVFSDDIEFCKKKFKEGSVDFVERGTEIGNFNMMASCQGIIMANSSFSFWAAYLGDINKKVVAPSAKNWHTDGIERTIIPSNWIRI